MDGNFSNNTYHFKKKKIEVTGIASLGWYMGRGYVQEKIKVKVDRYVIFDGDKKIAVCENKTHAQDIVDMLNM